MIGLCPSKTGHRFGCALKTNLATSTRNISVRSSLLRAWKKLAKARAVTGKIRATSGTPAFDPSYGLFENLIGKFCRRPAHIDHFIFQMIAYPMVLRHRHYVFRGLDANL